MFQRTTFLLASASILCLLMPAAPAEAEVSWVLRGGAVWVDVDGGSQQVLPSGDRVESDADSGLGFSLTAEVRTSERIGFEFGLLATSSQDFSVQVASDSGSFRVEDDLGLMIFGAGINFHLTPNKKTDVYIGPFLAYALIDDLGFLVPDEILPVGFLVDDEFGFGAVLGVDVPIDDRWFFNATARFIDLEIDPVGPDGGSDPVSLNPLTLGVGVGFRF